MQSPPGQAGDAPILRAAFERGLPPDAHLLLVDVGSQELIHRQGTGRVLARYAVSTSRRGLGCRADSGCTPIGFHRIRDRIGGGAPLGQVFEERRPIAVVLPPDQWRDRGEDTDRILTRILRLDGLEHGLNRGPGLDSYRRYIYLHGTNQEHLLGIPASHGCIRLGNRDIAELFDRLGDRPAWCWIGRRETEVSPVAKPGSAV